MLEKQPLIIQVPGGAAVDRELRAEPLPSMRSGAAVVEDLPPEPGGELEEPDVGKVVLSVPSPEALEREADAVRRVIDEAGSGPEPLIVEVEVAEHLREEELASVLDAAAHTERAVIVRVMRDA